MGKKSSLIKLKIEEVTIIFLKKGKTKTKIKYVIFFRENKMKSFEVM